MVTAAEGDDLQEFPIPDGEPRVRLLCPQPATEAVAARVIVGISRLRDVTAPLQSLEISSHSLRPPGRVVEGIGHLLPVAVVWVDRD